MTPASKHKFYRVLTVVSAIGLPLTVFALVMLFNPYAVELSATFSVHNALGEPVQVTPLGFGRVSSRSYRWRVLRQAAFAHTAAPSLRQARIPVAAGQTISIRASFEDVSLGAIAVSVPGAPERAVIVDARAAAGACCYVPKTPRVVIDPTVLVAADPPLVEAVERADRSDGITTWYAIVAAGLSFLVVFLFARVRYRALNRLLSPPAGGSRRGGSRRP